MIWYVEDDLSIRDIGMYALNSSGFDTRGFEDGISFYETLKKERANKPDLIILDVMLPGMDGIELLNKMKESMEFRDIPVIMASAKGQEYDRIKGLDLGADDYIVKPFGMMEMVSRVKAVLRRSQPQKASKLLKVDTLVVNLDEHTVTIDGSRVALTFKEYELLCMFLSHPGMVFTREQLFSSIWKMDYMGDSRTLDSHMRSLRHKIGRYGKKIETVRNVGYRWESEYDQ
ncbi:response regulator transcription factor [Allobaculum stercoricanis]|uniref:response regulator transcription factor n=1 Tax=Allobaculum stercoricanis TaxID=174709 RepID=UPI00037A1AE4|nr:response regulator transcription factor [Allobaculum stercoricanis]